MSTGMTRNLSALTLAGAEPGRTISFVPPPQATNDAAKTVVERIACARFIGFWVLLGGLRLCGKNLPPPRHLFHQNGVNFKHGRHRRTRFTRKKCGPGLHLPVDPE